MCVLLILSVGGCASDGVKSKDLTAGFRAEPTETDLDPEASALAVSDFALRLFKESLEEDKNTLISPLSVLCALSMTANGAENETLSQMEAVLGLSAEELNCFVKDYTDSLSSEEGSSLSLANSLWFTDDEGFTVNRDFLQTNANYFGAGIYKVPFDDTTLKDINSWVNEKTDEMIPEIIKKLPAGAVMCLINALAFDAKWEEVYTEGDVREALFTPSDGDMFMTDFMYSEEHHYLEDEKAAGFIKYYEGGKYAFAALLPNEGVSTEEYVQSLTGEGLINMLSQPQEVPVMAAIPKFETEYGTEMSEVLINMGMPDAFDASLADFSGLGTSEAGRIFINEVIHKTFISVAEEGTRAGAATAVIMYESGGYLEDPKTVYLDRPFVYMLIDCERDLPFFIGVLTDPTA